MGPFPLWRAKPKGLCLALRSWGVRKRVEFTSLLEENLQQIEYDRRFIARVWPLWLKRTWPQVEIWAGWSKVRLPDSNMILIG